jgi:mevalonate kinase
VVSMSFKASAPGSLMLLGEYAVLHGKHAVVCAVDRRITVTLVPRTDKQIIITSNVGNLITTITDLTIAPPFQFVIATLKKFQRQLPSGCEITIAAEFSDQVGLGSSAAVTTALFAALTAWLAISLSITDMIKQVRAIIRGVQGIGSGADVAACVLGGVVVYKAAPFYTEKLAGNLPLTAAYAGYKTPTVQAVLQVKEVFAHHRGIFQKLCQAIDECALQGIAAIKAENWQVLGTIMNMQQGLMESLGVNTPELAEAITALRSHPDILGAKISGSGLGDCVIGLGVAHNLSFNNNKLALIPVQMSTQGVRCEKI